MYDEGQGIDKDDSKAAYWYGEAAIRGYAPAQFNLAEMYAQGIVVI